MDLRAVARVVQYFRPLGFFRSFGEQPPAKVAEAIGTAPDDWLGPLITWQPNPEEPGGFSDLAVLAHDRSRVWRLESWERLMDRSAKSDGYAYCKTHADVVANLARIGAHRLKLGCADARGGKMTLLVGRRRIPIRFQTDLGVLSRDLIARVNDAIAPFGQEYAFVSSRFCTGYLVLLATAEKRRLATRRHWSFWRVGAPDGQEMPPALEFAPKIREDGRRF